MLTCNPRRQGQKDHWTFGASLVYISSSKQPELLSESPFQKERKVKSEAKSGLGCTLHHVIKNWQSEKWDFGKIDLGEATKGHTYKGNDLDWG